ncbi:hypothetical protein NFI96_024298 [Prochilodus magdalenae]|nr:hypothetical protein NFI96_024298 [Prochilodus magdalenae]
MPQTADKNIGVSLPSVTDIYTTPCTCKALSIVKDPTHPSHGLSSLLPSGRSMVGQAHTLTRSPGESVLLPCPCSSKGHVKPENVTWSYSKAGSSDRTPVSNDTGSYRGRVRTFDQTGSRNLSLLISDLTKEDAGQYTCTSDQHTAYVRLQVKGCALVENKQTGTVSRSSGESVLLSCTCTDPPEDTPVTVQWRGPNQEDLLQRSSRVQTFTRTSPGNLSVLISDLTVGDGGTYSCWINQNQYRSFCLTVKDCDTVIVVTVCVTVLVCAALLLIGGLIYRWRLSRTQEHSYERFPLLNIKPTSRVEHSSLTSSTVPQGPSLQAPREEHVPQAKTNQSDSVYQSLDPKTNQSDSVYQSLDPKTNQSDSVYQSLDPKTNQSDSVYQSLDVNTNQPVYQSPNLSCVGCSVERGLGGEITRSVGGSVVLPCSCKNLQEVPQAVQWGFTSKIIIGYYTADHSVFPEDGSPNHRYRDRVQRREQDTPGDLSLIISHLTEEDEGTYLCGNGGYSRAVTLYADDDYQNDPRNISMGPVYQSLDPKTNQSDSVYQSLNPNTNQSDSVYQSLNPKTNQSDSVYQSLNPKTNQSDSVYQSLNPSTNQSDSVYQSLDSAHRLLLVDCSQSSSDTESQMLVSVEVVVMSGDELETQGRRPTVELILRDPYPVDPQTVQWGYRKVFKQGDYRAEHSVFSKDGTQNQRYGDRVQRPTQNPPGQVSLIISRLTEEDEGTYLCGNRDYNRAVHLYVGGCSMVGQGHTLTRSPGESVLLPCACPPKGHIKPERVTWSYSKPRSSDRTPVSNDTGSYRGRVWTFDQTGSRNLSLLISDLTKEAAGDYTCTSDQHSSKVVLQVKGCALVENKQTGTVSRSSGESVLLSCTCTDPPEDTPVTVQWRGPNQEDLLQRSRVQTFTKTSPGNLSVLISDLTVEDGGTYSCWINQNQYRTFTLTVKDQNIPETVITHSPINTHCSSDEQNTNTELLYVPADCTLSQTQEEPITRYPGQSVLLPCSCTDPDTRPGSVKWERVDPGGTEGSSKEVIYSDRVQMFNKIHPSNLSLLISNLTEQDQGTYRCSINTKQPINIRLSITGCTLSQTQENQIIRYPGQSVLLPCSCTDPHTKPGSVKWERVDSGGKEGSSKEVIYSGRVQMFNKSHPANLSLLISNLTEQDQGTYRCSINMKQSIIIRLSITDIPGFTTEKVGIEDAMLYLLHRAHSHLDKGGSAVRVMFFDFSSAFTTIQPLRLKDKLARMQVDPHLVSWITDYLTGRPQHVRLKDCCTLSQTQENQIIRYPGESVLLPCSCNDTNTRPLSVKWERVDSGGTEGSSKMTIYSGRVQMFNMFHPSDLSLLIFNLTEQDQGTYRCSITNNQSISIRLSITGCTLSQTQENQIIRYPGQSVLLPCSCTDPNTRPLSVKWERVDPGGTEGSSKEMIYSDRVQMFNKSHPANLSLLISNLTEQDQGTYRCSINKQSINISLSITEQHRPNIRQSSDRIRDSAAAVVEVLEDMMVEEDDGVMEVY